MARGIDWTKVKGLGKRSDAEIASELRVTVSYAKRKRVEVTGIHRVSGPPRRDWKAEGVGVDLDIDIARRLGVTRQTVAQARERLGIRPPRTRRVILDLPDAIFHKARKRYPKLPPHRAIARVVEDAMRKR